MQTKKKITKRYNYIITLGYDVEKTFLFFKYTTQGNYTAYGHVYNDLEMSQQSMFEYLFDLARNELNSLKNLELGRRNTTIIFYRIKEELE